MFDLDLVEGFDRFDSLAFFMQSQTLIHLSMHGSDILDTTD
jgi:hypothetical protein